MHNGKTVTYNGKTGTDIGKTGIYFTALLCMPRKMGNGNLINAMRNIHFPLIVNSIPNAGKQ